MRNSVSYYETKVGWIFFMCSQDIQRRREMKKLLVVLVVLLAFLSVNQTNTYSADVQMKLGHFAAESHPGNIASKMFAEAVEKRTDGKIKITIYPNNALGSPPEVLEHQRPAIEEVEPNQ